MKLLSTSVLSTVIVSSLLLTGCSGGGFVDETNSGNTGSGSIGSGSGSGGSTLTWVEGEFTPYPNLANQCVANNTGSALNEKLWLRSWSNDTYLWYSEIPDNDPAPYSVSEYFDILKTTGLSETGNVKDRFHSSMSTAEWEQLNQSGASVSYGLNFHLQQASANVDRKITVTYTEPNSPASSANIERGAVIVSINGVSVKDANDSASISQLNQGLFPESSGQQTRFTLLDLGASQTHDVTLSAQTVVSTPVQNVNLIPTDNGTVGYIQFNSHIATAERGLVDAITSLRSNNVNDLILDLRYNGGGLLALASQLGYMIAGEQATQDRIFERSTFNNKYPSTNPVTGETLAPMPFIDESIGFNTDLLGAGQALPSLNLNRLYVLTTGNTCSASEALMNGLRGIDIEVIQIGDTTCGKPYGFYPTPNCGTTYFTIQFKGENDKGFGDYSDGFIPSTSPTLASEISGCDIGDDFSKPLGDVNEAMLSAALFYRDNNRCPAVSAAMAKSAPKPQFIDQGFMLQDTRMQNILLNNRILTQVK